ELLRIHLAQPFVALDGLPLARLFEQPAHRFLERPDFVALVAADDMSTLAHETGERAREIGDALVLRGLKKLPGQILVTGRAVLRLVDDDTCRMRIARVSHFDAEGTRPV